MAVPHLTVIPAKAGTHLDVVVAWECAVGRVIESWLPAVGNQKQNGFQLSLE